MSFQKVNVRNITLASPVTAKKRKEKVTMIPYIHCISHDFKEKLKENARKISIEC